MDSGHDEKRMNAEGRDRLSNLPDDIIHKILSFLEITQAIGTSELSSRWRYMWTSMPSLSFSSENFDSLPEFSKFVTHVLSRRNDQIDVSAVKLTFGEKISKTTVKKISKYMFNHNVQELNITCLPGRYVRRKIISQVPLPDFVSQSLQNLTLTAAYYDKSLITTPHTWELPSIALLNLHGIVLHYESTDKCVFSNCPNLKSLTISACKIRGLNVFNICHPGLSSLTLESGSNHSVNVVAPQLVNLTIKHWAGICLISAPNISSFCYKTGGISLELCEDLLQLEKVDISLSSKTENVDKIVSLLQQIHSVKFLALNSEIIESLSSSVELISHQPSPFANLKSLKIYPEFVNQYGKTESEEVSISTEVKSFLLESSPGATLTIVTHEEIRAEMNAVSTYHCMRELQVKLDRLGKKSKTDMTDMATVENHMATSLPFEERMEHIKCYWQRLSKQSEKNNRDTGYIVSKLQTIKKDITKLPTSYQEKLQEHFSRLCAKGDSVMDNMTDRMIMKMQCDRKLRHLNAYRLPE